MHLQSFRRTYRHSLVRAILCGLFLLTAATYTAAQTSPATDALPPHSQVESTPQLEGNFLSSVQLMQLAQHRPEIIVELKQLLADRLHEKGVTIQEDNITDEALFRSINSDPSFRAAATLTLQARGYITADTMRTWPLLSRRSDEGLNPHQDSLTATADSLSSDPRAEVSADLTPDILGTDVRDSLSQGDERSHQMALRRQSQERGYNITRTLPDDASAPTSYQSPRALRQFSDNVSSRSIDQIKDSPELLHKPSPYNLLALRDLYTQVSSHDTPPTRFGADIFERHGLANQASALDQPIGPDYILGPGDAVTISIWGGVSQTLTRIVDATGKLSLPEVGPIGVAGLPLHQAEALLQRTLAPQFRNAHIDLTLSRLRTVRIYVVGDVQRPGAYDLNALSSPLNALYAAGGPTTVGSLRTLRHLRGETLVAEIDLYDFLLRGLRATSTHLQSGDTIFVPPIGPQIAITGSVKRPAIYELHDEDNLSQVLALAGGTQVAASLRHISIERIVTNDARETVQVGSITDSIDTLQRSLQHVPVKDGDHVIVAAIAPWSDRAIYLEGHVVRPGRLPYRDGLTFADVIHSGIDLLPEPATQAEIIRLLPPNMHPEVIEFDLNDALAGRASIPLQPFDTIHISGRYEIDAPKVTIRGEVLRPGVYAMAQGMTAAQLVNLAGGFTRSALRTEADLASYEILNGSSVSSRRSTIEIGTAAQHPNSPADPVLKPGDVLTIHQASGWSDIGASIRINGEVTYPGTYGLQDGEKLSSVLRRSGGFRQTAYPDGAILLRLQVRDLEETSRLELIHQIETTSVAARLGPNISGQDQTSTLQLLMQQQEQVLQRLRAQPAKGRLVIRIGADINSWQNTAADIEMRSGDILIIPKRPSFVLVSGQVYNASALTFVPHKTAGWYLKNAGGPTDLANTKEIFIVRANGSVIGRRSSRMFEGDVLSTKLDAGDVIVVPQKIIGGGMFWRNAMTTAQLLSSIAIPLAIAGI